MDELNFNNRVNLTNWYTSTFNYNSKVHQLMTEVRTPFATLKEFLSELPQERLQIAEITEELSYSTRVDNIAEFVQACANRLYPGEEPEVIRQLVGEVLEDGSHRMKMIDLETGEVKLYIYLPSTTVNTPIDLTGIETPVIIRLASIRPIIGAKDKHKLDITLFSNRYGGYCVETLEESLKGVRCKKLTSFVGTDGNINIVAGNNCPEYMLITRAKVKVDKEKAKELTKLSIMVPNKFILVDEFPKLTDLTLRDHYWHVVNKITAERFPKLNKLMLGRLESRDEVTVQTSQLPDTVTKLTLMLYGDKVSYIVDTPLDTLTIIPGSTVNDYTTRVKVLSVPRRKIKVVCAGKKFRVELATRTKRN